MITVYLVTRKNWSLQKKIPKYQYNNFFEMISPAPEKNLIDSIDSEKMERYDWKITIKNVIRMMKLWGLWPAGDETYKLNIYTIYSIFVITVLNWGHEFFQTAKLFFILDDLKAVTGTLYVNLSEILVGVKAYFVIKNMTTLKQLLVTLNGDLFQPRNRNQLEMIKPDMKFWTMVSTTYWSFCFAETFFWSIFPILDNSFKDKRLPFLAWYPYKTDTSPLYEITYIYQCLGIACNAGTVACLDGLIAAIYMFIGAQFDILCDDIRHLFDFEKDEEILFNKLVNIVHHHQAILELYENSLKFTDMIVFGQFFVSTLVLGITMFVLTTIEPMSSEFFALAAYLIACGLQIFLYSYFGNNVELKSTKIPYACFESNWIDAPKKVKQLMVIFIERTQRPLKVMALNLFFLNLDTFMRILRAAYSYFALLHQVSAR